MALALFANLATSTLAGAISAGATTINLAAGTGALFPAPAVGQYFALTLTDQATGLTNEIVNVTARSADSLTVTRGQEGTTARSWLAGDKVANDFTAGTAAAMIQVTQLQQQFCNFGTDTGTANNYVLAINPAPANFAAITGSPIRLYVGNTNTGSSTLTLNGLATTLIINPNGSTLYANQLWAGTIAEFVYNGTNFILTSQSGSPRPSFISIQIFTSSGTFTVPPGISVLDVEIWGGGGGSGGVVGNVAGLNSNGGASGSGGGYARKLITVVPGTAIPVTIGAGGIGGVNGANATAGGNSSFGSYISATGGSYGYNGTSAGAGLIAGGPGVGIGGDINITGGPGGNSFFAGTTNTITVSAPGCSAFMPAGHPINGDNIGITATMPGCAGTAATTVTGLYSQGGGGFRGLCNVRW